MIETSHLSEVATLLHAGFRRRTVNYWAKGLENLARLTPPDGFPQFGYLLQAGTRSVGVHLLICSLFQDDPNGAVRSNVSSWYVEPEFRLYGTLLLVRATKQPATYVNIDPQPATLPIIEAQGFRKCGEGVFAAVPLLAGAKTAPVRILSHRADWLSASIPESDFRLLNDHQSFGCISLWCETSSGGHALIFRRRWVRPGIPCAQTIYCRSLEHLEQVAKPVGRFLAARGMSMMLVSADRKLRGVPGRFFADKLAIYCKGPHLPRMGDLSYTEAAVFGM
ncbi:MAG: hypothetical protein ACREF3_08850 [Acetobacteraceae bacterium]